MFNWFMIFNGFIPFPSLHKIIRNNSEITLKHLNLFFRQICYFKYIQLIIIRIFFYITFLCKCISKFFRCIPAPIAEI